MGILETMREWFSTKKKEKKADADERSDTGDDEPADIDHNQEPAERSDSEP